MAVAFFLHTSGTGIDASAEGTIPASTPDGAVMLAFLTHSSATATMTTPASGWTLLEADPNPADFSALAYWRIKQAGDAAPTWTWSVAGNWTVDIASFTGTHATTPVNTSIGEQIAAASAIVLGPVTPTAADCMLVAFGAVDAATGTRTWTESGAMTEALDQVNNEIHRVLAYELLSGGSGVGVSRTLTATDTAQDMAGFLVALAPAAGGGGGGGVAGRATARPPLELHAEIDTADGLARYRWDANARDPGDRPQGIQFGSTLMNGYANGGCSLARHISRDYPDLGIYDTLRFVGVDGRVAWEGRGSRFPREASTTHRISAEAVGWMSHARDKPIVFLGVDQDMASWGQMTAARQAVLQGAGYAIKGPGTVMADKTLSQSFDGPWPAGELPICEALFDAGPGQNIGKLFYVFVVGANVSTADPNWQWEAAVAVDTLRTGAVGTGNLNGVPANPALYIVASPAGMRYATVLLAYNTGPAGFADTQYNVDWPALQAIGDHGLPLQGAGPYGLLGSDIIKYIASLAAPLLDTSNVLATQHPIDQFVFKDQPTDVYDIWLVANQYERWNLAVWDDRKLYYHPLPDVSELQTADWVLRSDHRNGLTRGYDGPTADGQANGAIVRFQNILTGAAEMIDPTTNPELADTDTRLAANRAGLQVWEPIQLPNPNTPAGAARIGSAALAELNRQRTPGRFTITGHIQDAAGNWHQGWVPRAGDTVVLPQDEDDAQPIRVIHEVTWNHDSRTLTINADAAARTLDAIIADMDA